jgi:predicted PurR-regulated permease PerM
MIRSRAPPGLRRTCRRIVVFGIDLRAARTVWSAALVVLGLYCIWQVRTTLLVTLIAALFSYLVYPLFVQAARAFGRWLPRAAVLLLAFALVLTLMALVVILFGSRIVAEAATLAQQLPALLEPGTFEKRLPLPGVLEPFRARIGQFLRGMIEHGQAQALPFMRNLGTGLLHVFGNFIYVAVVPILSFLMILEVPAMEALLRALSGTRRGRFWSGAAHGLNFLLSRYVRALGLLSLATFISYGTVLSFLGVPFALLLAGAAAVLEVIPVFGPAVAGLSIAGVALFTGYPHVGWLAIFIIGYRLVQDYMISPYLMSEGVDVPPLLVVLGLLAGDELAGVTGIFLSVPFIAALRIMAVQVRLHREEVAQEQEQDAGQD